MNKEGGRDGDGKVQRMFNSLSMMVEPLIVGRATALSSCLAPLCWRTIRRWRLRWRNARQRYPARRLYALEMPRRSRGGAPPRAC